MQAHSGDGASFVGLGWERVWRFHPRVKAQLIANASLAGKWSYLCSALDSEGNAIDFMFTPHRDRISAKDLLQLALWHVGNFGHESSTSMDI